MEVSKKEVILIKFIFNFKLNKIYYFYTLDRMFIELCCAFFYSVRFLEPISEWHTRWDYATDGCLRRVCGSAPTCPRKILYPKSETIYGD